MAASLLAQPLSLDSNPGPAALEHWRFADEYKNYDRNHVNYRRLRDSRSALSWASILSGSNSIAAETRATLEGAGIGSPPTCCAPGWPSATSKDALVWIGAPRWLTLGTTR